MSYSGKFKDKNNNLHPVTSVLYGTCDTAAATAAKVVTCSDFDTLMTGVTIRVKFANANTAASPTVNINSTGAKSVYRFGSTAPVDGNSWNAGEVVELVYDGTSFFMTGADDIAAKQNATDNSLETEAKTIVGAINEHEGDIDTLKSGLTNLDNEVNGDAVEYPYADVITISDAVPANLAECSVKIEPVQSGSGDPSPENVRPITGHTESVVTRNGVNLLNPTKFARKDPNSGDASNNWAIWEDYIRCNYNDSLTLNCGIGHVQIYRIIVSCFDKYMNRLGNISETYIYGDGYTFTINIPGTKYCSVQLYNANSMADYDFSTAQLEYGSTATPYVPYAGQTYTIALGDTIYGGTVDFDSGVMTVDRAYAELNGTENWTAQGNGNRVYTDAVISAIKHASASGTVENILCNQYVATSSTNTYNGVMGISVNTQGYVEVADGVGGMNATTWKAALSSNPLQIVYELATPTTIQLTPQQIQLLKGTNTITASTGQISVTVNGVSGAIGSVQEQVNDHEERIEAVESGLTGLVKVTTAELTTNAYGWLNFPNNRVVLGAYVGDYKNIPLFYDSGNNRYYSRLYLDATATPISYASLDNNTAYTVTYVYIDNA